MLSKPRTDSLAEMEWETEEDGMGIRMSQIVLSFVPRRLIRRDRGPKAERMSTFFGRTFDISCDHSNSRKLTFESRCRVYKEF